MANQLRKAARQKAKLRVGLSGAAGSGKTYSALILAKAIASDMSKVAVIDTENGSADLLSHLGEYNVLRLNAPYTPERYAEAMQECAEAGMEVCILDSVSHEWEGSGGMIEYNDKIAQAKYKGNSWAAWSESGAKHQRFIEAITTSSMHVITTARAKTETVQHEGKIKKLGMKEIQRDGFEYELTLNFTIDRDTHMASASKDRTEIFEGKDPHVIDENTGRQLKEWAESGIDPAEIAAKEEADKLAQKEKEVAAAKEKAKHALKGKVFTQAKELGFVTVEDAKPEEKKAAFEAFIKKNTMLDLGDDNLQEVSNCLSILLSDKREIEKGAAATA